MSTSIRTSWSRINSHMGSLWILCVPIKNSLQRTTIRVGRVMIYLSESLSRRSTTAIRTHTSWLPPEFTLTYHTPSENDIYKEQTDRDKRKGWSCTKSRKMLRGGTFWEGASIWTGRTWTPKVSTEIGRTLSSLSLSSSCYRYCTPAFSPVWRSKCFCYILPRFIIFSSCQVAQLSDKQRTCQYRLFAFLAIVQKYRHVLRLPDEHTSLWAGKATEVL